MLIPKEIENDEILIRFIFLDNFKKKILDEDKINSQDIFLDTRLYGISLQRNSYTNENKCKEFALKIVSKKYAGFVVFLKKDFNQVVDDYISEREEFESVIEFTPLDRENNYLIDRKNSKTDDQGNPSHSDMIYINPAIKNEEPTPNTSLRLFSRRLMTRCKIIIDNDFENIEFKLGNFSDLILNNNPTKF